MNGSLVDRRKSKNYRQISGHIPAEQYRKFKATCAFKECTASEALEEAIDKWLQEQESKS